MSGYQRFGPAYEESELNMYIQDYIESKEDVNGAYVREPRYPESDGDDGFHVRTNWVLCRPNKDEIDGEKHIRDIDEGEDDGLRRRPAPARAPSVNSILCECSSPDAISKIDCECALRPKDDVVIPIEPPPTRERERSPPKRPGTSAPRQPHPEYQNNGRRPRHRDPAAPQRDGVARAQTQNHISRPEVNKSPPTRQHRQSRTADGSRVHRNGHDMVDGPTPPSPPTPPPPPPPPPSDYDISDVEFTLLRNGLADAAQGTCSCGNSYVNPGFSQEDALPTNLRGSATLLESSGPPSGSLSLPMHRAYTIDEPIPEEPSPEYESALTLPSPPAAVSQSPGYRMSLGGYHEKQAEGTPAASVDGRSSKSIDSVDNRKKPMERRASKLALPAPDLIVEKKPEKNEKLKAKANSGSDSSIDEDSKWLEWIEIQFQKIAGEDGQIDLSEFKKALGVKESFFAERFFSIFDEDKSGSIEMRELMDGLQIMTKGTRLQKLKFLFDVYDVDGSGSIDRDELKTVLQSCVGESSMQLSEEDLQDLTDALFDDADEDGSGAITFDELVDELKKYPEVMDNLTISAANWLKPPTPVKKKKKPMMRYFTKAYIMNNLRKVMFLVVFLFINLGLGALSVYRYWDSNIYVIIARVCGMCLNFNCTLVLVLMLRYTLTWIRTTPFGKYLPLDQTIMIHKLVGYIIFVQSIVHTIAHLINIYMVIDGVKSEEINAENVTSLPMTMNTVTDDNITGMTDDNMTWMTTDIPITSTLNPYAGLHYWDFLFTLRAKIGYIGPGFAYLSGDILIVILFIMVVGSMEFVRRGGFFMVFYWSHMLYILFWGFLITHGPIFWMFFAGPGVIFIIERVYMSKLFKVAKYGHTYIKEVNLLPSKVTHIVIARPKNFKYQPGDYVFINIPKVASQEWHPFTISSSPERDDAVWVHIRAVGHWTKLLYDFFDQYQSLDEIEEERGKGYSAINKKMSSILSPQQQAAERQKKAPKRGRGKGKMKKVKVEIYLDGPFGTSTREIFESEHAVLIGTGIGVTPYASILQSICHRYKQLHRCCPKCDHTWYDDSMSKNIMNLKCVDFVWINREQNCFDCFVSLLSEIELEQGKDPNFAEFLEMQMWMTSALDKSDMKAVGLQMAIEILHKKQNKDVVTGLKTRTQPGRPDWTEVFTKIKSKKKGQVSVFFCGAPALSRTLKEQCNNFGFTFAKENF